MSVYGMDLRRKIMAALGRGEAVASVARRLEVDQKTVRSYRRRAAEGTLEPRPAGRCGPVKLTAADLQTLRDELAAEPGLTLGQLRRKLSVEMAESTVCRAFQKLGLTLKKVADCGRAASARRGRTSGAAKELRHRPAVRAARVAGVPRQIPPEGPRATSTGSTAAAPGASAASTAGLTGIGEPPCC